MTWQVVHRLWLGPRPMPVTFRRYGRLWETLNPAWRLHDWSWQDLPEDLANTAVLEDLRARCTSGASVELATALADVIGYDLVARFGGVYVNCDVEPVRPMPLQMTDGEVAWASMEDDTHIVNAAFGGPPGHPFWQAVVGALGPRYWRLRQAGEQEMNQLTGPHLLGQVARELPRGYSGFMVFDRDTFNYLHWSAIPPGRTADGMWDMASLPPAAVGVHHWDHRRTGRSNIVT